MIRHIDTGKNVKRLIHNREILFAGNSKLRIFGILSCSSGKRMNINNRVFFKSANEAEQLGYRPCGHCLHKEYIKWKKRN